MLVDATPGTRVRYETSGFIAREAAEALAVRLLGDLRTAMGGLEINHARRVAARVRRTGGDRAYALALLHDVVDTGRTTPDELRAVTGDARLVELVEIVSRSTVGTDEQHLARCAADPTALLVKRADLADKLVADDSTISPEVGLRIRRHACRRLALLNALALRHAD